jgi:S-adenosylmethionine hydrolase
VPAPPRPITFLSDYGTADEFVGVCHGVMARIAPGVEIVDLAHELPRHDVRAGALMLRRALPYMPPGVHLAVVDPEVGTKRRAIALRTADEDRILVGPDNGLLALAAQRFGGAIDAVDVSRSDHRLDPVSATFHGRDIFAPVAAALAAGAELLDAGDPIDADEITLLHMPMAMVEPEGLIAHAVAFDRFGNITLDVEHQELTDSGPRLGRPVTINDQPAHYTVTFSDVGAGELLLYEDAYRTLAVAVNRGSARDALTVALDDEIIVRPA